MPANARKPPKSKKPTIAVRPPPSSADDFVKRDATASKRRRQASPTAHATTTRYTTKDGAELRRVTLWLPAAAAEAIGIFAARHQLRDSHIAALAVCKLLGVKPPASLAHVAALFPR